MSDPSLLKKSVVRIFPDNSPTIVGVGFRVSDNALITCAHVLNHVDERPRIYNTQISFDFPFIAPGEFHKAVLKLYKPEQDIAGLTFELPPDNQNFPLEYAELVNANVVEVQDHRMRTVGFPAGHDDGIWTEGRIIGSQIDGKWQFQDSEVTSYKVRRGFSGSAVWDDELRAITGMITAFEAEEQTKISFVIPIDFLERAWPRNISTKLLPEREYLLSNIIRPFTFAETDRSFVEPKIEVEKEKRQNTPPTSAFPEEFSRLQSEVAINSHQENIAVPSYVRLYTDKILDYLPSFILLGAPGSGKTTVLERLAVIAARRRLDDKSAPIPLYLKLSTWADQNMSGKSESIEKFIQTNFRLQLQHEKLQNLLKNGDVILFLDGLDEMGAFTSKGVNSLKIWLSKEYRPKRLVISCRKMDYGPEAELQLPKAYIQDMDWEDIERFAVALLADESSKFLDSLQKRPHLAALAKTPYFLIAMIYIVWQGDNIPENQYELIGNLCKIAWERELAPVKHKGKLWDIKEMEQTFSYLAYSMFLQNKAKTVYDEWVVKLIIKNPFAYVVGDKRKKANNSLRAAETAHIITRELDKVRFFHGIIQEYLAALYIKENPIKGLPAPSFDKAGKLSLHHWKPVLFLLMDTLPYPEITNAFLKKNPYLFLLLENSPQAFLITEYKKKILRSMLAELSQFLSPGATAVTNRMKLITQLIKSTKYNDAENDLLKIASDPKISIRAASICVLGEIGGDKTLVTLKEISESYIEQIEESKNRISELKKELLPSRIKKVAAGVGIAVLVVGVAIISSEGSSSSSGSSKNDGGSSYSSYDSGRYSRRNSYDGTSNSSTNYSESDSEKPLSQTEILEKELKEVKDKKRNLDNEYSKISTYIEATTKKIENHLSNPEF